VRHLLDSLDGSYLTCERRVADAKPFDPIRFRHDRRNRVSAFLTTDAAAAYRPALDRVTAAIDGFQSPHGMELLATVDWLRREAGTEMAVTPMMAAITAWPGPDGAADRKRRIFTAAQVETAIDHLMATDPI